MSTSPSATSPEVRTRPGGDVADLVCPILPVQHESDLYYTWTQGDFSDRRHRPRPDRAEPRAVEFTASTSSYRRSDARSPGHLRPERENADDQLLLERTKQDGVLGRLALLREMADRSVVEHQHHHHGRG